MTRFRPCLVVPVYNHGIAARRLVPLLGAYGYPVYLIDDGSTLEQSELREAARSADARLIVHERNRGKGAAVLSGLTQAYADGYTHGLQIDADGQHAHEDVPRFMELARLHPDAVIAGQPVYDASVPRSRLFGRYITHFWVWVETLSFDIKDSMCGFRVYPLAPVMQMLTSTTPGQRMDFDIDILVRLFWAQVPMHFLRTRVTYPADGRSHFRLLADNWLITRTHTRLFLSMLWRLPWLLARKFKRGRQ